MDEKQLAEKKAQRERILAMQSATQAKRDELGLTRDEWWQTIDADCAINPEMKPARPAPFAPPPRPQPSAPQAAVPAEKPAQ